MLIFSFRRGALLRGIETLLNFRECYSFREAMLIKGLLLLKGVLLLGCAACSMWHAAYVLQPETPAFCDLSEVLLIRGAFYKCMSYIPKAANQFRIK